MPSTKEGSLVKFNLWLVIFLALMPVFLLFTGMSAAAAFQSSAEWQVIGIVLAAAIAVGYLATRRQSEIAEEMPTEATVPKDAYLAVRESDVGKEASYSSPPCFMHELDPSYLGYLKPEERLAPAFHRSFEEQTRNAIGRAVTVGTSSRADEHEDSRSAEPIS